MTPCLLHPTKSATNASLAGANIVPTYETANTDSIHDLANEIIEMRMTKEERVHATTWEETMTPTRDDTKSQ